MKKYIVSNIYEADYGCEGLKEGENIKVIVDLIDEMGQNLRMEVEDDWLIQQKIQEESKVILDTSEKLKKVVEVVAAVIKGNGKKQGEILATQRGYGEFQGGWEFPGGKIEKGETAQEALVREIKEELDLEIKVEDFIDSVEYEYPAFYLSMECYWCRMISEDFILKEHKAAKWLSKETLNSVDWLPADIGLIDTLSELI